MKRTCVVIWALALFAIILPLTAEAVDPPSHFGLAIGINCASCHQPHRTLGPSNSQLLPDKTVPIIRTSPAVFNNICQTCHRPGDGFAKAKPMALVDTSSIFGDHSTAGFGKLRQTSHRWDGSDTNPAAGALAPVQAAMTTNTNGVLNLRGRTGNQLACVRCHSPHLSGAPGAMLRMGVENDQLCRDCHRTRDQQSHLSGTHPIGVNYDTAAAKGNFNNPPLNANPANPTSDLSKRFTKGGFTQAIPLAPSVPVPDRTIICSTCHGVHYTDSRSSTFDGSSTAKGRGNYVNLSSGDGYQLRTDRRGSKVSSGTPDKLNICTNCHANKKSHNAKDQDVQCVDCHGAHVEYDATNSPVLNPQNLTNVYLVRRNVNNHGTPSKIYFRYTGSQREYKNAQGTGVCQGCHKVPEAGGKYPPEHDSNKASDCKNCHFHSSQAGSFSGSCGQCHGMPPNSATPGPGGLALPATGALLAGAVGAHAAHVTSGLKMECNGCHEGYANRVMPSKTIDIGFAVNGVNVPGFTNVPISGTYNNNNPLSNGYTFTGPVGAGPNQTCSAIYCHGSTLTGGSNLSPSWVGGISQVACGTCHGASASTPPTTASHARHAGAGVGQLQIACANCHGLHTDNKHVNGNVKWNFAALNGGQYKTPSGRFYTISGSTGRLAPSAAYGTCSNIYCHSNGGPNGAAIAYTTMTWGGASLNCGSCHANMATTPAANGGHFKHSSTGNTSGPAFDCSACHTGYTATSTNGTTHANKLVELNGAVTGYSKVSPMPAGGAWGTCSTSKCHGSATGLIWNNGTIWQTGGDHCTTCHSSTAAAAVSAGNPFYSTEYPTKQTSNLNAKVGAHTLHLTNINVMNASLVCTDCHGTVALKDATHMNGVSNFNWSVLAKTGGLTPSYNTSTGTCSNVYCHGAAMPGSDTSGNNKTPSWKTPFMPATLTPESCKSCHGFPPVNANHPVLASPTSFPTSDCSGCHPNISATGTTYANIFVDKTLHINGVVNSTGGSCNGCHGYPPSNKRFKGTQNNWSSARQENYSGGGGAHTVAGHIPPTANPSQAWANCTNCHNQNDHAMSPLAFNPSSNIKVNIDHEYKFSVDRPAKYTSNGLDGALHVSGNCSNIACHFQKTPKW